MKMLILYDSSGKIWTSMTIDGVVAGLEKFCFDVPNNSYPDYVDLSDPENPTPHYIETETYDVGQMNDDITDLQVALAEVYEMITGGV